MTDSDTPGPDVAGVSHVPVTRETIRTRIYEDGAARRRLRELGLDYDRLVEVVEEGERARAGATAHDPIIAGAWDAYRYRVRSLRNAFVPTQWAPDCVQGIELLRSPDAGRVIMTRSGDASVGRANGFPQPVRTFGEAVARVVGANESLLLDPDWFNIGAALPVGQETWILLVHYDISRDVARAELSHPSGTSASGRVEAWVERVLLPEIDFTSPARQQIPDPHEAAELDVESLVTRKR